MKRLFCFPFAGGTEKAYDFMIQFLPDNIELIQCSAPGKGARFQEVHSPSFQDLVDQYYDQLLFDKPYLLFGHSMGALVAHCLLHKILVEKRPLPEELIVSGKEGPSLHIDRKRDGFDKQDIIKLLVSIGALTESAATSVDHSILDPFKKDLIILDQWPKRFFPKHDVPLTFLFGMNDLLNKEASSSWQKTTIKKIKVVPFSGGHFYYLNHKKQFVHEITM